MSALLDFVPTWIYYVILFAGIGGTLITILFGILIPIQFKLALQVVSTIALVIGSFFIGAESTEDRWRMEILKQQAEIVRLEGLSQQVTTEVVTKYLEKKIYIKEKGNEIIKQIPVYVTQKADDNCIITNGVVRLLNAAAKNEIPDTSSSINGGTTQNATTSK